MKVIVVGAGAAGLAAAHELRKKGAEVVVFEESGSSGGRARGFQEKGYVFDLGAQFSAALCHTTLEYCRELGMGEEILPFDFTAAVYRKGKLYPMASTPKPGVIWRMRKDLLKFRGAPYWAIPQILRVFPSMLRRKKDFDFSTMDPEPVLDLCDISIAEYALRHGGKGALEYFFQPLSVSLTLGEPEEIGAAHILALLFGVFGSGLVGLARGIGSLMQAMYEANAEAIRLNTPVRRIILENGRARGVEIDAGTEEADAVICATTASNAIRLTPGLPDALRIPLEKVTYSSCVHFIFALRNRLLPDDWYGVIIPRSEGTLHGGFSDASCKSPYFAPLKGGLVHSFTYGKRSPELEKLPEEELKRMMIRELQTIVPGRMPDEPFHTVTARWKEAICLDPPGQAQAIHFMRRDHYREVPGLFLAGEYMYLVSCVEGALRSGVEAASAAIQA
ncbi:MAG: FAD-dependent oxidoreductase [Actinobacteria bacterium]|nr:FAD-dependent oxidoreductase [Actinomycetota bacterium]